MMRLRAIPTQFLRSLDVKLQGVSLPKRSASFYKSNVEESPDKYTEFEKSFKEWKYVEKLIPPTHVPEPPKLEQGVVTPSGWTAPSPPSDTTYLIRRTKNHQMPVYVQIFERGQRRLTVIRKVEGNIWQCEKDVGEYLQKEKPKKVIITHTNEINRQVFIKGDFVEEVKQWMIERGF